MVATVTEMHTYNSTVVLAFCCTSSHPSRHHLLLSCRGCSCYIFTECWHFDVRLLIPLAITNYYRLVVVLVVYTYIYTKYEEKTRNMSCETDDNGNAKFDSFRYYEKQLKRFSHGRSGGKKGKKMA